MKKRAHLWTIAIGTAVLSLGVLAVAADWWIALPADAVPTYVGRNTCQQCHQAEHEKWVGSHHDLAMDLANPDTVLGDFEDRQLTYLDTTARMFRRDSKYFVRTEGPDGRPDDFEVKYVFGFDPLQQYMVEFDDGRVQVLRECWDTKAKRWLYQYPPDLQDEKLRPTDPLHWTGNLSNWNHMCAKCHSTGLEKNYDPKADRFHTSFSEIDVSCETCHGPGSLHVQLAEQKGLFWDRRHGYGLPTLKDKNTKYEIETCAPCHSRHHNVYAGWSPGDEFLDFMAPALLAERLYHADGQILDEVYVYGSFLQSKMHAKGVRCTDCHDPHTTRLKHEGNKLCTSCHQHPAGKYDVPAHHFHQVGTPGASCVECHMPSKHYMIVDPRRDHSMRVPRPDLSVDLGTPNACTACHLETDKSDKYEHYEDWLAAAADGDAMAQKEIQRVDQWCADAVQKWYGDKPDRKPHFAYALDAARRGTPEAEELLTLQLKNRELPAIAKATVVQHLGRLNTYSSQSLLLQTLSDPEPLVRSASVNGLGNSGLSNQQLATALSPLLGDPVRLVRTDTARALAGARNSVAQADRESLLAALEEYRTGQLAEQDQAAAQMNLGNLAQDLSDTEEAVRRYKLALQRDGSLATARFNLGLIYTQQDKRDLAEKEYRYLIDQIPEAPILERERLPLLALAYHRLGLVQALQDDSAEAEESLRKAVELQPATYDFRYILGVFYLQQLQWDDAKRTARELLGQFPNDQQAQALMRDAIQQRAPAR